MYIDSLIYLGFVRSNFNLVAGKTPISWIDTASGLQVLHPADQFGIIALFC